MALATRRTPERNSPLLSGLPIAKVTATTDSTAGAKTYTAAELLGGLILRDPNGAARSDVTPTAALLAAAIPGAEVGSAFEFAIRNTADAAETLTITAGTGATLSGTGMLTVPQGATRVFRVVFTGVLAGSEAYTLYSLVNGFVTQAANPDTSGAALAVLETEVNEVKAALRAVGIIG